jgi:hypothetical protein
MAELTEPTASSCCSSAHAGSAIIRARKPSS